MSLRLILYVIHTTFVLASKKRVWWKSREDKGQFEPVLFLAVLPLGAAVVPLNCQVLPLVSGTSFLAYRLPQLSFWKFYLFLKSELAVVPLGASGTSGALPRATAGQR